MTAALATPLARSAVPAARTPHRVEGTSAARTSSGSDHGADAVLADAGALPAPTVATTPTAAPVAATSNPVVVPEQPTLLHALTELRTQPDGVHELNVTLHPAELGAVHVRATLHDGTLDVTVACADDGARAAVTAALPTLHQQLDSLGSLDVRVAGDTAAAPQRDSAGAGLPDTPDGRSGGRDQPSGGQQRRRDGPTGPDESFERWM